MVRICYLFSARFTRDPFFCLFNHFVHGQSLKSIDLTIALELQLHFFLSKSVIRQRFGNRVHGRATVMKCFLKNAAMFAWKAFHGRRSLSQSAVHLLIIFFEHWQFL